jgi:glutamate--cysteine ligase
MSTTSLSLEEENKQRLIQYFKEGCKPSKTNDLGMEIEHFIVRSDTKQAVSFYGKHGISYLLEELSGYYAKQNLLVSKDRLSFSVPDFTITLEPAAQLEISIAPMEHISDIEQTYRQFYEVLLQLITPLGYECAACGYQPASTASELTLIPKQRYEYMNQYFLNFGTGGMQMMTGTASTQISLDFTSETDFRRKIQAAYLLMPYLKLLTDNTPVFEGEKNTMPLRRTEIWNRVDQARTGILPNVFSPQFGFSDYVDYLWNLPLIFLPYDIGQTVCASYLYGDRDELDIYTAKKTTKELFFAQRLQKDSILHILSMAFPDVRVKNYLELRGADSLPLPLALGYAALVKGLLYSESVLDGCADAITALHICETSVTDAEQALMKLGWEAVIYAKPVRTGIRELLTCAASHLPPAERHYLDAFDAVIH